ncbi:MAG: hypothetical protein JWQ40_4664 [Segetibacter sp.]|jgi:hypothetical protein|nr:hypothetical protein [Segetibacter sp.]
MKRIALILLICIYSASTFGVSLKEFYCCGKLKSVSLTLTRNGKDKCGIGDNNDDCCKTKYQLFKVKDKHLVSADVTTPVKHFVALNLFFTSRKPISFVPGVIIVTNGSNAPPRYSGVPVYISNCVFRV